MQNDPRRGRSGRQWRLDVEQEGVDLKRSIPFLERLAPLAHHADKQPAPFTQKGLGIVLLVQERDDGGGRLGEGFTGAASKVAAGLTVSLEIDVDSVCATFNGQEEHGY